MNSTRTLKLAFAAALVAACLPAFAEEDAVAKEVSSAYKIDVSETTHAVKPGQKGKLVIAFKVSGPDYHINPKAPLSIKLEAPAGVKPEKTELGHKDANDPAALAPVFEVPFTAAAAGKQDVKADAAFFVCKESKDATKNWCVRQTAKLDIPVDVK